MSSNPVWFLLTGLVVGLIAQLLVRTRRPLGCIGTTLVGIAGAFFGGLIGRVIWSSDSRPGIFMSILGASLLLLLADLFSS